MRDNNRQAFLGERVAAYSTTGGGSGEEAITNMLAFMNDTGDVWLGQLGGRTTQLEGLARLLRCQNPAILLC
jgi:hypothetical protein